MSQSTALPSTTYQPNSPSSNKPNARCAFFTNAHRRCRLRVADAASSLCFRHFQLANLHRHNAAPDTAAQGLLSEVQHFTDANSINRFLGNVVRQLVLKRISRQDAVAYGYLSQLLLNTLRPLTIEHDSADAAATLEKITADAWRFAPKRDLHPETPPSDTAPHSQPPAAEFTTPISEPS
jgi:hypothetical protein